MTGEIKGCFFFRQSQTLKALWWWSKESAQRVFPVVKIRFVFFCVTTPCSLVGKKKTRDRDSTCKILTTTYQTYQSMCCHKTTPHESSKHWMFSLHLSWIWITERVDMKAMHFKQFSFLWILVVGNCVWDVATMPTYSNILASSALLFVAFRPYPKVPVLEWDESRGFVHKGSMQTKR